MLITHASIIFANPCDNRQIWVRGDDNLQVISTHFDLGKIKSISNTKFVLEHTYYPIHGDGWLELQLSNGQSVGIFFHVDNTDVGGRCKIGSVTTYNENYNIYHFTYADKDTFDLVKFIY